MPEQEATVVRAEAAPEITPPDAGPVPKASSQARSDDRHLAAAGRPAHTRASASWTAVVVAVVILIALIVFIAQNTQRSSVKFLGFHGSASVAVELLIAAVAGAVVVIGVGAARIVQLRRSAKRIARSR